MIIIFMMSGGPYDYIFFLHYIDCWGSTGFCYFKIISNLGRVWPAQNSMWRTLSLGAMTKPLSQGASFNPSAPFSEQPNWHQRSWEKVVSWMLITFQPLTMEVTMNHQLRDEKSPCSTTNSQNCPVPKYSKLAECGKRDQKSVLHLLPFKHVSEFPTCPLKVPVEGLWKALLD